MQVISFSQVQKDFIAHVFLSLKSLKVILIYLKLSCYNCVRDFLCPRLGAWSKKKSLTLGRRNRVVPLKDIIYDWYCKNRKYSILVK